jgi:hypothetical protein
VDIAGARFFGLAVADAAGNATISRNVPAGASGRTLRAQVVDRLSCSVTKVDATLFD